jgi:hypothetical protein
MRIVADTNIVLSGLLWQAPPAPPARSGPPARRHTLQQPHPPGRACRGHQDIDKSDRTTEYAIGIDIVYVAFRWNKAGLSYETTRRLAKHAVGFLDASGDRGEVWFPSGNERLELTHEGPIGDEGQGRLAKQAADAKKRADIIHCASREDLVTQMLVWIRRTPKASLLIQLRPNLSNECAP